MGALHLGPEKDRFHYTVGNAIREAREAAGISQVELARQAGITQGAIQSAERGNACPLMVLAKIAFALDTTLDALVPLEALQ